MGRCFLGSISFLLLLFLLVCQNCMASVRFIGKLDPGFQGAQMNWIDNSGVILVSNNSLYGFGFTTTAPDVTKFLLVVVHMSSTRVIWTANRGSPVANSDKFVFSKDGKVSLQKDGGVVWTAEAGGKSVSSIQLLDSGNLAFVGNDGKVIWESFNHPTDTLITGQQFDTGMKLVSDPTSSTNLTYILQIKSGDLILSAGFKTPQQYWSLQNDNRKTIDSNGGGVSVATIEGNSWKLYDSGQVLLSQFIFSDSSSANGTWIAAMGNDGFISFYNLDAGGTIAAAPTKIPDNPCSRPVSCGAYLVCSSNNVCQCPSTLNSLPNCNSGISNSCKASAGSTELVDAGNQLNYFAVRFAKPTSKTDLEGCKSSCRGNCSCLALFFQSNSGSCFLFDEVGSFTGSSSASGFNAFIKVSSKGRSGANSGGSSSRFPFGAIIAIAIATMFIILGLLLVAFRYYRRRNKLPESLGDSSEDDTFLENLRGMPIRFGYKELQNATNNFSVKLGQGGFGSVYQGLLPDGTRLAVKKLEGIGQGKKEFRAEVSIIGSTHHHHLVRLKGFCAEGSHRLLAYEFMANGSLEQWIFKGKHEEFLLDWETRFNIALGTAKGLAYLHQDCDVKIIHCDIKPENVLLDDNFLAKVSDFGLAKLMTREQSHVFTTMRGTRGYLAPEWITNYAISEKSDVYSYGMLLLEIISGRKNFVQSESSEKSHFPSYAFKMMEEGKVREILDSQLKLDEEDERVGTAIKVALWCIQEDMYVRPSMTKVVQMLEGICPVPKPPTSSPLTARLYSGIFKSISEEGASSGQSDCNSEAYQSAVRLSGPR